MKKISLLTFGLAASLTAAAQVKPNIVYIQLDIYRMDYHLLKYLYPQT